MKYGRKGEIKGKVEGKIKTEKMETQDNRMNVREVKIEQSRGERKRRRRRGRMMKYDRKGEKKGKVEAKEKNRRK